MKSYVQSIYYDDYEDMIGDYKILLGYGVSKEDSYEKIKEYYYKEFCDSSMEYRFWIILFEFQSMNGILCEEVKNKAGIFLNEKYANTEEEKEIFDKVIKLSGTSQKERKFRKPPKYLRDKTFFNIGDIYSFKITHPLIQWGDSVSQQNKEMYEKTQKYLMDRLVYFRVVNIDKTPVSAIIPELDYSSCAIIELLDVVCDKEECFKIGKDYSPRPFIASSRRSENDIYPYIALEPYEEKEIKEWGVFNFVSNKGDVVYDIKGDAPYVDVSHLVLGLIWTFM